MMSALPPRSGESPRRGGVSRLEMMQAKFQAKQLEEKEEKMIQILEDKQERTVQRVNYGRDSANSTNSFSSSASSNSVTGGVGARPAARLRRGGASPVGWDKSYPLEPVEAVNEVVRTPLYKQNVSRNNSYNKYSGNYGPRAGQPANSYGKRGMSLDRNKARHSQQGYTSTMTRAHSQANIGHSSSEDSFTGSARPYSGLGYHGTANMRTRKPSGGAGTARYNYGASPENSPPQQRKSSYQTLARQDRDYTRPLPPTYRRQNSRSRLTEPSPSRHSYHDSAYSSHSSQSSDPSAPSASSAFSVIQSPTGSLARPALSTQSSPSKSYSRQNSFSYEQNSRINSRTFRKQKSPVRHRSPSISPTRSAENSDETDLALNDDYGPRGFSRNAERAREEERRRMQVEMRKREQELLSKIKEQQKELDAVKAEKTKVERELTRAEREREEERRELERQRMELESRKSQESEVDRRDSYRRPYERVLNREKASPAHLRGRRPPSLVSSENDEEVEQLCKAPDSAARSVPITVIKSDDSVVRPPTHKSPVRCGPSTNGLHRRASLRQTRADSSGELSRSQSVRLTKENKTQQVGRVPQSPSLQRREVKNKDKLPLSAPRTPSSRRKAESESNSKSTKDGGNRRVGLSRLRGSRAPSREPSFEDDRESSRSSVKSRSTTYISGGSNNTNSSSNNSNSSSSNNNSNNNTVKIEIKDAKKSVPPSPAIKKKAPAGSSTPARRSLFASKPRDDLVACKNCGRNFADDRIEKHEEICLRTSSKAKKRKVFDMTKARVKGTDAAKYVKSSTHLKNMEAKEQKKSDWRKKREEFINNLRAAKEVQRHLANGGSIKDLPPPPPSDTSDYIQCPHCGRRFSEGAADRHIPKCKDIKSNKKR